MKNVSSLILFFIVFIGVQFVFKKLIMAAKDINKVIF